MQHSLKLYSSLDSPKTGSGDHENVYSGGSNNIEIYDPNGEIGLLRTNFAKLDIFVVDDM